MPEQEKDRSEQKTPVKPSKAKKWPLVMLGIAVVAGAVASGIYFEGGFSATEASTAATKSSKKVAKDNFRKVNEILQFDPFVVNLTATGDMHYLRIGLSLGIGGNRSDEPVQQSKILFPKIKDLLIDIIAQKSPEELAKFANRDKLKEEIKQRINNILPADKGRVFEVYFTDYIVQ